MAGPRTRALFSTLFALSLVTSLTHARDYRYSDAHVHYVDFFQESEGMPRLLEAMDKGRVDHVMLSGVAVAKKWHEDEPKRPRYYAGDDAGAYWYSATDVIVAAAVKSLPAEQRRRVHPFLTGFNPTDKNADAHIRRMLELDPGLWQGIGEIFTRHDDLTALTYGDVPRANNEALARVYHLAAEFDLPVLLHANVTSKRERNPLYLAEIEEPLRNHPHVRFIWAHAGTSMEIHRHQKKLTSSCRPFGVCYSATRTSTSTCPGRCCARTCWTSRASPIRSGWHWSSGFRNASCSVPMWSASSTACPS